MKRKDKKVLAAVKARAKAKAIVRNRGGAVVQDLDRPDGQYTKQIICVECGAPRKVKPQDAWQVKRCVDCQGKKSGAKFRQMVERKSSPEGKRDDRIKRAVARLDQFVKDDDARIADFAAKRKRFEEMHAKQPKAKRIWP